MVQVNVKELMLKNPVSLRCISENFHHQNITSQITKYSFTYRCMVGWRTVIKQRDKDKRWEGNSPNMPLGWPKQKWAYTEAPTSEEHHVPDQAKWAQLDYEKSQAPGFSGGSCSTRFHSLPFEFRVEWTLDWFSVWSVHGWNTSWGFQSAWHCIGR